MVRGARVPHRQLQYNFDDNYWVGFWTVLVTSALVATTLLVFCIVVFKINVWKEIFGKPADTSKRPAAYGILIACVGFVLLAMVYYVRHSGGLIGVGSDAVQTGERYNSVLTDGSLPP